MPLPAYLFNKVDIYLFVEMHSIGEMQISSAEI